MKKTTTKKTKLKLVPKTKVFTDFDDMMKHQKGVRASEFKKLIGTDDFEEHNDYLMMEAHAGSTTIAISFALKNKLYIITECIYDGDEGTTFSFSRGLRYVNRERYYFTRKNDDVECDEHIYNDEDEEESDDE